jgi:4-amino-4-deoxy-L-arabinose transferase-like glycosyltransferase
MTISAPPPIARQPVLALQAAVLALLVLKVFYFTTLPPIGDEAYYWLWGQRLALSYLDHPPLHAWLLRLMSVLFGWNLYSLRALTWVTFAGTAWALWLFSKRLSPDNARPWFWAALALYLGSPLLFVLSSISFHDHLLMVLCLFSGYFFLTFAQGWQAGRPGFARLYVATLLLGFAVLTKYNALFLGLAFLGFILINPKFRPLLARPQAYLAAAIGVAVQAPVFYWNLANGFASYRFHAVDRWQGDVAFDPSNLAFTLIAGALTLSVFLVLPALRLYETPEGNDFERLARPLAGIALAISSGVILLIAMFVNVSSYWNVVAYPLSFPVLVAIVRTRTVFWLHILFGGLLSALFLLDMSVTPVTQVIGVAPSGEYSNYDWDKIAAIVAAAHAQNPASFLAATRYTTAAQLAFALRDPDVTDISNRHTEFNFWFDPVAHTGQSALVLAMPALPIDFAKTQFRSVALLRNISITRFGTELGTYQLYKADFYCGGTCK